MNTLPAQLALPLRPANPPLRAETDELCNLLLAAGTWLTARDISERTGWDPRTIRELAARSEGRVAGGQHGYKHIRHMTSDEYHHFRNWMKSQADKMTARILASDILFYSRQPIQK